MDVRESTNTKLLVLIHNLSKKLEKTKDNTKVKSFPSIIMHNNSTQIRDTTYLDQVSEWFRLSIPKIPFKFKE